MVGEKISLRKRVGLAVLTVLMLLSAVFGAIFMRGIFGDATQTANAEKIATSNYALSDGDAVVYDFDAISTDWSIVANGEFSMPINKAYSWYNGNVGSVYYVKNGAASNTTVPAIADAATNGISVSFHLTNGGTSDWDTTAINANNLKVNLFTLQSWGNAANITPANAVPSSYQTGFNYTSCLGKKDAFITITLNSDNSIVYYKNGTRVTSYASNDKSIANNDESFTVSDFMTELFVEIANNGFTALGGVTGSDLTVTSALSDAQAVSLYSAYLENGDLLVAADVVAGGVTYAKSDLSAQTIINNDTADTWWAGATTDVNGLNGDFALIWRWTNTRDTGYAADVVYEFGATIDDEYRAFDMSALAQNPWVFNDFPMGTVQSKVYTLNGETVDTISDGTDGYYGGDYTTTIIRKGSTLVVREVFQNVNDVVTSTVIFTGFTEVDLVGRLAGNPYYADNIVAYLGGASLASSTTEVNPGWSFVADELGSTHVTSYVAYVGGNLDIVTYLTNDDTTYSYKTRNAVTSGNKNIYLEYETNSISQYSATAATWYYDNENHWLTSEYNYAHDTAGENGACSVCGYSSSMNLVGATDFSTAYLGDKSDIVTLSKGEIVTFTFTNFCNETGYDLYKNWLGVVYDSNDASLSEWRSDGPDVKIAADTNWDWDKAWFGVTGPSDVTYATMNEATVVLAYTHTGSKVTMSATVTSKDKTVTYTMSNTVHEVSGDSVVEKSISDPVKVCVSVDRAYLTNVSYAKTYISYGITYDLAGGSVAQDNANSYTVATETFTLTNPTKVGYTFAGWTGTDLNEETETVTIEVGSTGNRSYIATWNVVEYNITYDLDLGEWDVENEDEEIPTTYTIETATFDIPTPVRPGYTFVKWTNAADETVTEIAQGNTGNVTLTANWSDNVTSIRIATWNLVLNDRIGIRYQMEGVATNGYSVKFSIDGRKDVSASVSLENDEYWYTLYINALEMGDEVTVSVYSGDTEVKRLSGSTAVAYCKMVEGYTDADREKYNISDEALDLVESLHDYGYYMGQTGWSDGCEHTQVADSKNVFTSESITAVVEAGDVFNTTFDKTLDESSVSKATMSMTFSDQSTINFFVYLNDGYSVESATINGVATTPTLVDNNSNKYQVTTARLKPTELAGYKTVIITAVNGDNTEHVTILTASALTYVKLVLNSESFTDTVKYAITSYYNYYVAANAYANSVTSD